MPELVPVDEAARKLGIGRSTVFRYIRLGLVEAHRRHLDRRTYVDLEELRVLMENPPFRDP
jgi:DNA-binding transcriptional MerR regulator